MLRLAAGGRAPHQATIWVKDCIDGEPVEVAVDDGKLNVARDGASAARKLGSRWWWILPVLAVAVCIPAADNDGWVPHVTCCLAAAADWTIHPPGSAGST